MKSIRIRITKEGTIVYVPTEDFRSRHAGPRHTRRASHVEPWSELTIAAQLALQDRYPAAAFCDDHWFADLAPLQGPLLGPFFSREAALFAESCWLQEEVFSLKETPIVTPLAQY